MSRASILSVLVVVAFLTGCARYATVDPETVSPGYTVGGGEWNTGGGITAVARVFERGGATVVCGAWATDRQSVLSSLLNQDVMQAASVYSGGTRLVHNLGFMARTPYSDNITGSQANCVASSVPWRAEFAAVEPRLRFPRVVFPLDGGDDMSGGSGDSVSFRETPRPNIVH